VDDNIHKEREGMIMSTRSGEFPFLDGIDRMIGINKINPVNPNYSFINQLLTQLEVVTTWFLP